MTDQIKTSENPTPTTEVTEVSTAPAIPTHQPVVSKADDTVNWKAKHDEQGFAMRQAQKINAEQAEQIAALEAKTAEPQDIDSRVAGLEVKLARSQAVAKYGLTEEQAGRLKGSPDEIIQDAEYWASQKPAVKETVATETSNREMIKADVAGNGYTPPASQVTQPTTTANTPAPPPTPVAVTQTESWMDRYKAATPAVRYTMDEQVKAGLVDPTK